VASTWLDEVDLSPESSPLTMGTRALGDRPWLLIDDRRDHELALKAQLCADRHAEVFAGGPESQDAGQTVVELIEASGLTVMDDPDLHALDRAGRSVQEDLCLMHRRPDGWRLEAASLCFPSRWRLSTKIGRHVTEVHGPVEGYRARLAGRVDSLFDRLTERPVWRRNWFGHPAGPLFHPERPAAGDPIVAATAAATALVVRSERQTLRLLPSVEHWILFTIRVQQATLADFVAAPGRGAAFRAYLRLAPTDVLTHRGLTPPQIAEVKQWLRD
jgi:hypothetical protein